MRLLAPFAALLAVTFACLFIFIQPSRAVVGGGQKPHQLVLDQLVMVAGPRARCTGTLLTTSLVLTAAHCVHAGGQYTIVKPAENLRQNSHAVDQIERHPGFDPDLPVAKRRPADIALVKIGGVLPEVSANNFVVGATAVRRGEEIWIAGFGVNSLDAWWKSGVPLMTKLTVSTNSKDFIWLYDPVANPETGGISGCNGDSGAPAFAMRGSTVVVVGVVVGAAESRGCGGQTLAVSVIPHLVWLTETAHKLGTSLP